MFLIDDILKYKSISVVGLAKNVGKTECLNYILGKIKDTGRSFAVTSIGIDGESVDQVSHTPKPEIKIYDGMFFITSEKHYTEKRLTAEILDISQNQTSLGRLVTARALSDGKVLLSGPADTTFLKQIIREMGRFGVDTVFVDGALSRLSLASPAITEAMVLATGAAVSGNIQQLIRKTKYVHDLIQLERINDKFYNDLINIDSGVWAIDTEGMVHDLEIPSLLMLDHQKDSIFRYGNILYVTGVVSDGFLQFLRMQKNIKDITLIVKDFTRIFASPESYYAFLKKGGQIRVLYKSKLLAVCINPWSPSGYRLDSNELKYAMEESLGIPVYDVRKLPN